MTSYFKLTLALFLALMVSLPALSETHDHGVGEIKTKTMELYYIDHVLFGKVGDRPVYATPLEKEFGLNLWHRAHGEDFTTTLKKQGNKLVGEVKSLDAEKREIQTEFEILKMDPKTGTVEGRLGEESFTVSVSSEKTNGHHYVSPHFEIDFENGTSVSFDLEGGQACMGCIARLSYAVISMLHTNGEF